MRAAAQRSTVTRKGSVSGRRFLLPGAALLVAAIFAGLAACSQLRDTAGQPLTVAAPQGETAGLTGNSATPYARPGQSLPMQSAREITIETERGSMLSLDLSPDGTTLVFDMLGSIFLLPAAGGEATALTSGLALDVQPVWSPDGQSILFVSDRSGAENLWLMDADGGNPRQISFYDDNPVFTSPEWTPDGKAILVTRFWADRNAYELWRFRAVPGDMGEVVRSTRPRPGMSRNVSSLGARPEPDGNGLWLASLVDASPLFDGLSPWGIIRLDLETGEELDVVPAGREAGMVVPRFRPAVSPDGRHLVFGERRSGVSQLVAMNLGTGDVRTLTELDPDAALAALTSDAIARYDFTPDGDAVLLNRGGLIERVPLDGGEITRIPFSVTLTKQLGPLGRHPAPLEDGPVVARLIQAPELSPDGARLAFSAIGDVFVQALASREPPQKLRSDGVTGYHPSWSPDGWELVHVSWTHEDGGHVWIITPATGDIRRVSDEAAFYTHPVFTPDGRSLVIVRSPAEERRQFYKEFGQLREAELVVIPLDGGAPQMLTSGRIGGRPHFADIAGEVLFNSDKGVEAVALTGGPRRLVTQAVGPGWYFSEGPLPADDLRVSPDGRWALARITHQLHLYRLSDDPATPIDLSKPQVRHVRLTDIGGDYFGWSTDASELYWAVGSTLRQIALADVEFVRARPEAASRRTDIRVERARDVPSGRILLTGGHVLAMTSRDAPGDILPDTDVLIDGNRIARIAPKGEIAADAGTEIIELGGAYVMPGLIDAHYHVADIRRDVLDRRVWGLQANLAYGITTVFDPSSLTIDMLAYQDMGEAGEVFGARLFTTGPAIYDYYDFRTAEQVRAVLTRYREHYRVWNIKQYRTGNRRVRQWIAEAANAMGMTATTEGALSYRFGLTAILDGYSGVEHGIPPIDQFGDFTELFARSGTSSTLTLMITHGGLPADKLFVARNEAFGNQKYADFVPTWFREKRFRNVPVHPVCHYTFGDVGASALRMRRAGGIVGIGAHGDIPGLGTHWELRAHVESGWEAAEALWAATMGSAKTISRDAFIGSLEAGKLADLLIIEGNPLNDIGRLQTPRFVMKNGRLYHGGTLLEAAATSTR